MYAVRNGNFGALESCRERGPDCVDSFSHSGRKKKRMFQSRLSRGSRYRRRRDDSLSKANSFWEVWEVWDGEGMGNRCYTRRSQQTEPTGTRFDVFRGWDSRDGQGCTEGADGRHPPRRIPFIMHPLTLCDV